MMEKQQGVVDATSEFDMRMRQQGVVDATSFRLEGCRAWLMRPRVDVGRQQGVVDATSRVDVGEAAGRG